MASQTNNKTWCLPNRIEDINGSSKRSGRLYQGKCNVSCALGSMIQEKAKFMKMSDDNYVTLGASGEPGSSQARSIRLKPVYRTSYFKKMHFKETLDEPTILGKVKRSALFYEITERTNKLALPRIRVADEPQGQQILNNKRVRETSARVLELSKPKQIQHVPSRPLGVNPTALKAIPTQRVIELSRPRRWRTPKVQRKKKLIYAPCSARIIYLARPRQMIISEQIHSQLRQLHGLQLLKRHSMTNLLKKYEAKMRYQFRGKIHRSRKKRKWTKRFKRLSALSDSDRSVITVDFNPESTRGKSTKRRSMDCVT